MANPSPKARAALDGYIQTLSSMGEDLRLEDFRSKQILEAQKTARAVRWVIVVASVAFMGIAIATLIAAKCATSLPCSHEDGNSFDISLAAIWAMALGGLGAVSSIFIHMLKLIPQETLRTSDKFEIIGRIILGCLFGSILTITLAPQDLANFFESINVARSAAKGSVTTLKGSITLLLPFLAGYSIPLVLKVLDKAILAIEFAIGLNDERAAGIQRRSSSKRRESL